MVIYKSERQPRYKYGDMRLSLHPNAIFAQVQTGNLPPGWQVFRGKRRSLTRRLLVEWNVKTIAVFLACCGVLAIVVFFINDFLDLLSMITDEYRRSHFDFWNNPNMPVQYAFPETVFAVLFLLFFTAFISDLVASRDPILILLPDGLVEFDQQATLVAHMAFTELADIRYQENTDDSNKARSKALELIYNDGFTTIWTPSTPTTDAIIAAFQQWRVARET